MTGRKGIVSGLTAGMLWGLDSVLLGEVRNTVLVTACIHDGLAGLWILLINIKNRKAYQYMDCLRRRQFIAVLFCALLGGTGGMLLNITAVRLAGASAACGVTSAYPAAGVLLGILFLHEKCGIGTIAGIVGVACGTALMGFGQAVSMETPGFMWGMLAAFGAMLCWALEGVLAKSAMAHISSDVLIGIREMVSCSGCLVILAAAGDFESIISIQGFRFIFAASLAGGISYLCWYRSMDLSGVGVGMSLNATYALWTVVFDTLLNGYKASRYVFWGIALIFAGTVTTIRFQGKENKSE